MNNASILLGFRALSSSISYHQAFCEPNHPKVIPVLNRLHAKHASLLPTGKDVIFEFRLADGALKRRRGEPNPTTMLPPEVVEQIVALAKVMLQDVLSITTLLTRIPFEQMARRLTPEVMLLAFQDDDLIPTPDDVVLAHGNLVALSGAGFPGSDAITPREEKIMREGKKVVQVTYPVPGLPDAVMIFRPRSKPKITLPGIPRSHTLFDWKRGNKLFPEMLFASLEQALGLPTLSF